MRRAAAATDELRSEAQKGPPRRALLFGGAGELGRVRTAA